MARQRRPFSLNWLVGLALLFMGIAAALNPSKAGDVWHAFTETLTAIAWACVSVFL